MIADQLPANLRTLLIKAMFHDVSMDRLMRQPGVKEEHAELVFLLIGEAEDVVHDWSENL